MAECGIIWYKLEMSVVIKAGVANDIVSEKLINM